MAAFDQNLNPYGDPNDPNAQKRQPGIAQLPPNPYGTNMPPGGKINYQDPNAAPAPPPIPTAATPATPVVKTEGAPTGGALSDPAYVDQLLAYWGNQPGVNPSVKNDPNYWRQRIASGAFGNDQGYLTGRFMTPEGAPEGAGGGQGAPQSYNYQQAVQKVEQASGRKLSQADIDGLFQKFGGNKNDTFTDASLAPVIASLGGGDTRSKNLGPGGPTPPPGSDVASAGYIPGKGVGGMGSIFGGGQGGGNPLFQLLMGRATQGLNVNPNDPIIKGQTDAFRAEQQRGERGYEQQLAERAGANANIGAERRLGAEKVGQNTSAFESQLMGQELSARRQEIQNALSGAAGLLTADQQMMLQEELSQLDLAQRAYEFDINDQFRNSPLNG